MNTNKCIIIVSLILAILVIVFIIFYKRETFVGDAFTKLNILEGEGGRIINEFNSFDGFVTLPDPVNENKDLQFMKMNSKSSFVFSRSEVNKMEDFSLGVYFRKKNKTARYSNFIVGNNGTDDTLKITLDIGKIIIIYEEDNMEIPVEIDTSDGESKLSYLFIKANINGLNGQPPTLEIIIDNKRYKMTMSSSLGSTLELKQFIFGNNTTSSSGFEGLIGQILIYNELVGNTTMCKYYNCNINCFAPDGSTDYDGNVNLCITDCMRSCNDIEKCQNICVNCEVEGKIWDSAKKKEMCPWLSEIKVVQSLAEAPQIRGFPGDGKILVEWKKPFDGQSEISNYVVLYYETFNKKTGVNVSISGKSSTDICEYEIQHLKNRTYYDIVVRAVNTQGIGPTSNIITVAPNGNVISNNNRNIFSELEEELQKEVDNTSLDFRCDMNNFDSIGHTLDFYDDDISDIKSYIEKLKK
jgi:hypothetical protein